MDFRTPRSADIGTPGRPEPSRRPPVEQQPVVEEPKPVHRMTTSHHSSTDEKSKKRFVVPIVIVAVLLALVLGGLFLFSKMQAAGTGIDRSKYQAVFFTNGQVYFGKLQAFNDDYMKMTDIYYLQTQETQTDTDDKKNPQETSTDQSNVQLIKLGEEVHGPEDAMIISRDQVLFYENLKSDGKVAQTIEQSKKQ